VSRYTNEELQDMAKEFVACEAKTDQRSLQVVLMISAITGIEPPEVRTRIHRMSRGEFE